MAIFFIQYISIFYKGITRFLKKFRFYMTIITFYKIFYYSSCAKFAIQIQKYQESW